MNTFALLLLSGVECMSHFPIIGSYIWGIEDPNISKHELRSLVEYLTKEGHSLKDQYSMIQLRWTRNQLWIDLVKKSEANWGKSSFCSTMLGPTLRHFREILGYLEVDRISVVNASRTPYIACRCYVRSLVGFGFDFVNSRKLENDDDVAEFCENAPDEMHAYNLKKSVACPLHVGDDLFEKAAIDIAGLNDDPLELPIIEEID